MLKEYQIREMQILDIMDVMDIENSVFTVPWSMDSYLSELKNWWAHYQVCVQGRKVVGYIGVWVILDQSHLTNVAVAKSAQGQGIGKALMLAAEQLVRNKAGKRIILEVRPSNEVALHLYRSLGYYEISRRTAYYSDNHEDVIIMCKDLVEVDDRV